jgi:hypothetical protein
MSVETSNWFGLDKVDTFNRRILRREVSNNEAEAIQAVRGSSNQKLCAALRKKV